MEIWDVRNREGEKSGKTVSRKEALVDKSVFEKGEYHLSVEVFIINSRGQLLFTKRSPHKDNYPDLWETTAGSAISGEESLETMVREIGEEIGLEVQPEDLIYKGRLVENVRSQLMDLYFLYCDQDIDSFTLQEEETWDIKWRDLSWEILEDPEIVEPMRDRMKFIWLDLLDFARENCKR